MKRFSERSRRRVVATVSALMIAAALSFGIQNAYSAEPIRFAARVKLQVSAEGATASIVRSYLSRELRKLDGVVLSDEDPGYQLSVVLMETRNQANYVTGYALSSVGLSLWSRSSVESMVQAASISETQKMFLRMFAENGTLVHHLLQTGAQSDLETLCSILVASFDTNALESARKVMQDLQDRLGTTGMKRR